MFLLNRNLMFPAIYRDLNLQYKMFLLNPSIMDSMFIATVFTIQNVPIKYIYQPIGLL